VLHLAALLKNGVTVREFAVLVIALVVVLVAIFVVLAFVIISRAHPRAERVERASERPIDPPELVLARRLAAGEIEEGEYRRRLDALHGRATPPPS